MNKYKNFYNLLDKVINIIFIILIGLIFYTLYRSEIVYDGLYRNYYLKYYIFLISSFFILLFINFFLKKIKIQIYITVISIIIGLYISETLFFHNTFSHCTISLLKSVKNKGYRDTRRPHRFHETGRGGGT